MILALRIAGVLLLSLAALNLFLPRRFGWRDELARVSVLTRQIFFVHAAFIILTLVMMGMLALFFAEDLLAPSPLARAVLAGLTIFWAARLYTQWFVYDRSLWRGKRFETGVQIVFTLVWAFFAGTFGTALASQVM